MLVVTGIFENERFIPDRPISIPQKKKVVVTIEEKNTAMPGKRRQEAFENFMKYRGTLPADFDYAKELNEYRDERYGHTH